MTHPRLVSDMSPLPDKILDQIDSRHINQFDNSSRNHLTINPRILYVVIDPLTQRFLVRYGIKVFIKTYLKVFNVTFGTILGANFWLTTPSHRKQLNKLNQHFLQTSG